VDDERTPAEQDEPMTPPPPPSEPATIPPPPDQPAQVVYHVTQPTISNGLATAAMVCGIVGVVLFFTIWIGVILGILAIVFGAVGRSRADQGAPNKGQATAGLWLGIVAVLVSVLFAIVVTTWVTSSEQRLRDVVACVNDPDMC
jgi:peptidoglycan/LPS O-acetylase OafA/YrhL